VVELVYTADLKSADESHAGSTPATRTNIESVPWLINLGSSTVIGNLDMNSTLKHRTAASILMEQMAMLKKDGALSNILIPVPDTRLFKSCLSDCKQPVYLGEYSQEYITFRRDMQWMMTNNNPMQIQADLNIRATKWAGDPYALMAFRFKEQVQSS
jgi:hypothetical protein